MMSHDEKTDHNLSQPELPLADSSSPSSDPIDFKKELRRVARIAIGLWVLFRLSAWYTLKDHSADSMFSLVASGWGASFSFLAGSLFISVLFFIYSSIGNLTRRSIRIALKLTFLLMLGVLEFMQYSRPIAVIQKPDRFVFLKRYPLDSVFIKNTDIEAIRINDTGIVRGLKVEKYYRGGNKLIDCESVWHSDKATTAVMYRLENALREAKR